MELPCLFEGAQPSDVDGAGFADQPGNLDSGQPLHASRHRWRGQGRGGHGNMHPFAELVNQLVVACDVVAQPGRHLQRSMPGDHNIDRLAVLMLRCR